LVATPNRLAVAGDGLRAGSLQLLRPLVFPAANGPGFGIRSAHPEFKEKVSEALAAVSPPPDNGIVSGLMHGL